MIVELILGRDFLEGYYKERKNRSQTVFDWIYDTLKHTEVIVDKDDQPNEFEELVTINYVTVVEIEIAEPYRSRIETQLESTIQRIRWRLLSRDQDHTEGSNARSLAST